MSCNYCTEFVHQEHPVCECVEPCARPTCPALLQNFDISAIPVPRFPAQSEKSST
jgi:hypothetical protein